MAIAIQEIPELVGIATGKVARLTTGGNPSIIIRTAANAILATIPFTPSTPNATTGIFSFTTLPVSANASATGIAARYTVQNGAGTQLFRGIAGKFAFIVDTGTDILTATSHDFVNGEAVFVASAGTLPVPLAAPTVYYVIDSTTPTLKLSLTPNGTAVDITTVGTGVFFIYRITSGITIPAVITSGDIVQINLATLKPDATVV